MKQYTMTREDLEKYLTQAVALGMFTGFVIGALFMFLIAHFRWELI